MVGRDCDSREAAVGLQGAVCHASGCYQIPASDKCVCMCVLSCVNISESLRELAQREG